MSVGVPYIADTKFVEMGDNGKENTSHNIE